MTSAQNTFEKVIDTLGCSSAGCIQETFDGGYIFSGQSNYNSNDAIVVKLDSMGVVEWAKLYGGTSLEGAGFIQQTPDSGYIVGGVYDGGLFTKGWLLRLDNNGDTLWTKTYSSGVGATEIAQFAANSYGSIYAMAGYFKPSPFTHNRINFITVLNNGFLLANSTFDFSIYGSESRGINHTVDGGFIITGLKGYSSTGADLCLIRTDAYGDTAWTRVYPNQFMTVGQSVVQTDDSGYVVAGYVYNPAKAHPDVYLIKTDSVGDTLWTKTYYNSVSANAQSIYQLSSGEYVLAGSRLGKFYIIHSDISGDTVWTREFGDTLSLNIGLYVKQAKDGGILACGVGNKSGKAGAYIIKTDSSGNVVTGLNEPVIGTVSELLIYPNPSNGILTVSTKGLPNKKSVLKMYNSIGDSVYAGTIVNNMESQLDLCNLPEGIYILVVETKEIVLTKKVVIYK